MIRSLIRLALLVIIGIVAYNFFMGSSTEKDGAKQVVKEFKDVGVAVKDLLKSEKTKFEGGKYNEVLDNIGGVFTNLKSKAKEIDEKYVDRIANLDRKRQELEERLETSEVDPSKAGSIAQVNNTPEQKKLKLDLKKLMADTEALVREMNTKESSN